MEVKECESMITGILCDLDELSDHIQYENYVSAKEELLGNVLNNVIKKRRVSEKQKEMIVDIKHQVEKRMDLLYGS